MAEIVELEPLELKRRLDRGDAPAILDVREPEEVALVAFPGARHIPMGEIPSRLNELDPDAEWVIVCHHGMRSANVAMYLSQRDFEHLANLTGGIDAWALEVDPAMARY